MKNHEGSYRGYHRSSKAWYANSLKKEKIEVNFGMYGEDGGTSGEMSIKWHELDSKLCARLECFEDGWSALGLFSDVIEKLAAVDSEVIQEEDFVKILDECGFKDDTAYENPYEKAEKDLVIVELTKQEATKMELTDKIHGDELVRVKLHKDEAEKLGLTDKIKTDDK